MKLTDMLYKMKHPIVEEVLEINDGNQLMYKK